MIDAVLSYHLNPATCGVAKFNQRLARELGVACDDVREIHRYTHPLVSLKIAEGGTSRLWPGNGISIYQRYDLFLHDWFRMACSQDRAWVDHAQTVYGANRVVAEAIAQDAMERHRGVEVREAWCPSTIEGNYRRGMINVLTFGMAHKIQTARYEKLKALLDATGTNYTVSLSTAVHEGSPWDEIATAGETLRAVFGSSLRVLGFLADDALVKELCEATAVALFFDPALRANNTTFWTAMDAGVPILTNMDAYSPQQVRTAAADIDDLVQWPSHLWGSGWREDRARQQSKAYSWDKLTDLLCAK